MENTYSFEQRRMAYLKTEAGPADKVAMVLAILPALVIVVPLFIFIDNIIIVKIIGTFIGEADFQVLLCQESEKVIYSAGRRKALTISYDSKSFLFNNLNSRFLTNHQEKRPIAYFWHRSPQKNACLSHVCEKNVYLRIALANRHQER